MKQPTDVSLVSHIHLSQPILIESQRNVLIPSLGRETPLGGDATRRHEDTVECVNSYRFRAGADNLLVLMLN